MSNVLQGASGASVGQSPIVTVLMPVYNGMPYLEAAITSIFEQTFDDFELLAIDDGSTDGSYEYLAGLSDSRIRLVRHARNMGLVATLNEGLDLVRGEFVARMDSDDLSARDRLAKQVEYMRVHPEVDVLATGWRKFGELHSVRMAPTKAADIRAAMVFGNCLCTPSCMYRSSTFRAQKIRYEPVQHAEDYELLSRLSETMELRALPDVLYSYRVHAASVSQVHDAKQWRNARAIGAGLLRRWLGIDPTDVELEAHALCMRPVHADASELLTMLRWVVRLGAYRARMPGLADQLAYRRWRILRQVSPLSAVVAFLKSPLDFRFGDILPLGANLVRRVFPVRDAGSRRRTAG
jgi:glycosyltransferase involved in cell wall biosynthesis